MYVIKDNVFRAEQQKIMSVLYSAKKRLCLFPTFNIIFSFSLLKHDTEVSCCKVKEKCNYMIPPPGGERYVGNGKSSFPIPEFNLLPKLGITLH
jgi:hypothetical protein